MGRIQQSLLERMQRGLCETHTKVAALDLLIPPNDPLTRQDRLQARVCLLPVISWPCEMYESLANIRSGHPSSTEHKGVVPVLWSIEPFLGDIISPDLSLHRKRQPEVLQGTGGPKTCAPQKRRVDLTARPSPGMARFGDLSWPGGPRHTASPSYLGGRRTAASSRIVSPLKYGFSTIWCTSIANSAGLPRRLGKGMCSTMASFI
jgi:hypothetical protein